jgi:hypothetical protein
VPPGCLSDGGDGDRATHAGRDSTRAMPKSHTCNVDPLLYQPLYPLSYQPPSEFSLDSEVRDVYTLARP